MVDTAEGCAANQPNLDRLRVKHRLLMRNPYEVQQYRVLHTHLYGQWTDLLESSVEVDLGVLVGCESSLAAPQHISTVFYCERTDQLPIDPSQTLHLDDELCWGKGEMADGRSPSVCLITAVQMEGSALLLVWLALLLTGFAGHLCRGELPGPLRWQDGFPLTTVLQKVELTLRFENFDMNMCSSHS